MPELLSIEEAQALVLERVQPLPGERVALAAAAGRVLAEAAVAAVDLPPFASSAMDGFAVRAADTPGRLPIAGHVAAGRPASGPLAAGEAVGIATGGAVPDGADAVVPVEYVVVHDNEVEIPEAAAPGASVRPRGGDVAAGDEVVAPGTRLGPAQIGALAAAGVAEVVCARRPRALVLATGNELRPPGEPLDDGQIYESNSFLLLAALAGAGAAAERLGTVVDTEEAHRDAIARGLEADVLVSSGGVSVGPHDLVRRIERELGVEEVFWRVAVKPGKPVAFAVRGDTLVFGLPGNPVSSLVGFELFVRPALRALRGSADPRPAYRQARLAATVRRDPGRDELMRARFVDGSLEPITGQDSHMIARAALAEALVRIPHGDGEIEAGTQVSYLSI